MSLCAVVGVLLVVARWRWKVSVSGQRRSTDVVRLGSSVVVIVATLPIRGGGVPNGYGSILYDAGIGRYRELD